jgi:hypothetical protein
MKYRAPVGTPALQYTGATIHARGDAGVTLFPQSRARAVGSGFTTATHRPNVRVVIESLRRKW